MQGIFFCGAHLVAGLTPAFIVGGGLLGPWPGLLRVMSWRGVFVTFGLVGVAWVVTWIYCSGLRLMGALFLIGAGCWALVDPGQPVFAERKHAQPRRLPWNDVES